MINGIIILTGLYFILKNLKEKEQFDPNKVTKKYNNIIIIINAINIVANDNFIYLTSFTWIGRHTGVFCFGKSKRAVSIITVLYLSDSFFLVGSAFSTIIPVIKPF